jgi:hypothetical protein
MAIEAAHVLSAIQMGAFCSRFFHFLVKSFSQNPAQNSSRNQLRALETAAVAAMHK